jgi:hypothetical protein
VTVCATRQVDSHPGLISILLARNRFTGFPIDDPLEPIPHLNPPRFQNPEAQMDQLDRRLPSIRLGGGGFVNFRNRGNPDTFNIHNIISGNAQTMHRRALELDNERLPGRLLEHYDDVLTAQELAYPRLFGGIRQAIGNVMNPFGWGNVVNAYLNGRVASTPARPLSPLEMDGRFGARTGAGAREEPQYRDSFTHPGKMPKGFTFDFAPVEPDTVSSEESDNGAYDPLFDEPGSEFLLQRKRRKMKGKGKAPIRTPAPSTTQKLLGTVCVHCGDPLMIDGSEDQKLYGLQCGHVLDGKCIWKIGVPPPPVPSPSFADVKGKGKETQEPFNSADPSFKFTFNLPPKPTLQRDEEAGLTLGQYQEVNDPTPLYIPEDIRSRLRSRRELVPTPSASKRRHLHQLGSNIDGVDDTLPSDNTPSLNLFDPFFPVINNPPITAATRRSRNNKKRKKAHARPIVPGRDSNHRIRSVPNTGGRLKEEVYEWNCPVQDCGMPHLSVRLDAEGAKWRCEDKLGATGMFL